MPQCHELLHKLLAHHKRLRNFPPKIANAAADASINPRIALMLREQRQSYGPIFAQGWGLESEEEMARYRKLSEEQIARELMQTSQSRPQQSPQHAHAQGTAHPYGSPRDIHSVPLPQLIEILERNRDITYVKGLLELPNSDQGQLIRELEQQTRAGIVHKADEARSLMKQYGDRYPGKHVDDFALEVLEELEAPKVEWIAGVADLLAGRGSHMTYSTDYPGKLFYVDPRDMSLPHEVYVGSHLPAQSDSSVLLLVDTSRSVDRQLLRRFFSEGLGVLQRQCGISTVYAYCADTVVRGKPIRVTRDNIAGFLKRIEARGRGGTDFVAPIREAWTHPDLHRERRRIKALLYFTDLGAQPPRRADLPPDLPPMAFVTVPGCFSRGFANSVRDYARVIEIQPRTVINLDTLGKPLPAVASQWRLRPRR